MLSDAERDFLRLAFTLGDDGSCSIPSWCSVRSRSPARPRSRPLSADDDPAVRWSLSLKATASRTILSRRSPACFMMIKRICRGHAAAAREAKITANKITFPALGATITALASDYAGAAGGNPTITCFDELWGYTSRALSPTLGRDDHQPGAQDQLRGSR